jgi:hypothetical protein
MSFFFFFKKKRNFLENRKANRFCLGVGTSGRGGRYKERV